MASAGKFLNAPAAQTDVLAEQATSPPATVDSNKRLSALQNYRAFLDPIAALPFELLEIIFQLALPSLDIMAWDWDIRAYHPYMAALYILRRISTMWKDIVDGTPSLWAVICASFPENVNLGSLVRSGSSRLVIYFPGPSWSTGMAFREFLPIIEPHLHRCSSLALWIKSELVDSVPCLSPLPLVALKIRVDYERLPREVIPLIREIEISDEALENIRAVDVTRVPMDWARTLEHLSGLRTLALGGVYDNTITVEQILSALVSAHSIESLTISEMEIGDSLSPSTEPIYFPHLRAITLHTNGALTNGLLRRIGPSPAITKLDIRPTGFPSHVPMSFWHETMVPWIPVVQRLCQNSSGPTVYLAHRRSCMLESNSVYHLFIIFGHLSQVAALRWIQDVISPVTDIDNGGLQLRVSGAAFENEGVLETIQTMRDLTAIIVSPVDRDFWASREVFINVLGQPTTDSAGTPTLKSTFPTLKKLALHSWRWNLDMIMDMIKKRYSIRSLYRQQIPDLTLDLSTMGPSLWLWRDRTIISFSEMKALRELDGVNEVRMGCVKKDPRMYLLIPGMVAIVWDEEKSLPAWG
ncbi:hypothetical protein FS837_000228 [Tulasnella sp. UAMH 9824]|nr:hypothetical protein FS837_000228 [Tulasnella sp. UAMH 9824]